MALALYRLIFLVSHNVCHKCFSPFQRQKFQRSVEETLQWAMIQCWNISIGNLGNMSLI